MYLSAIIIREIPSFTMVNVLWEKEIAYKSEGLSGASKITLISKDSAIYMNWPISHTGQKIKGGWTGAYLQVKPMGL